MTAKSRRERLTVEVEPEVKASLTRVGRWKNAGRSGI
jgi:hypothetical protein